LALLLGLVFLAALVAPRLGVAVAILELLLGVVAGNLLGIHSSTTTWLPLLATLGGVVLTFLAGVETDAAHLRAEWRSSILIGVVSFAGAFATATLLAFTVLHWSWTASLLAGVALSETSVAVVYVILTETGDSRSATGRLLLSACFVTDLIAAGTLTLLFAPLGWATLLLAIVLLLLVLVVPRVAAPMLERLGATSTESTIKFVLFLLVVLGAVAVAAGSTAVLPAYVLGVLFSGEFARHRDSLGRLRSVTLAFLTPFFFIAAGLNLSAAAVLGAGAAVGVLLIAKIGAKIVTVYPVARRVGGTSAPYVSLLNATGLTFGIIFAVAGLSAGWVDQGQYSVLVTVVVVSAIVPTVVAQKWFRPSAEPRPSTG
jgi:Kef-type K+ transport system membrane component KefB